MACCDEFQRLIPGWKPNSDEAQRCVGAKATPQRLGPWKTGVLVGWVRMVHRTERPYFHRLMIKWMMLLGVSFFQRQSHNKPYTNVLFKPLGLGIEGVSFHWRTFVMSQLVWTGIPNCPLYALPKGHSCIGWVAGIWLHVSASWPHDPLLNVVFFGL